MQIHCSESHALWGAREEAALLPNPAESGKQEQELARVAGQSLAGESNAQQFKDVFKTGA